MLDAARQVQEWLAEKDETVFRADRMLRSAILHELQIIGEAASHISPEFRARHPEIIWRGIIGMRQVVVHEYWRVDLDIA
jgi:uncharacterized protein with HEPN domain